MCRIASRVLGRFLVLLSFSCSANAVPIYDNLSSFRNLLGAGAALGPFDDDIYVVARQFTADTSAIFGSIELLAFTVSPGLHTFSFGIYSDEENKIGSLREEVHFPGPSRNASTSLQLVEGFSPTRNTALIAGESYWIVGRSSHFSTWQANFSGDRLFGARSTDGGDTFNYIPVTIGPAFRINSDVPIPSTALLILLTFGGVWRLGRKEKTGFKSV